MSTGPLDFFLDLSSNFAVFRSPIVCNFHEIFLYMASVFCFFGS